MFGRLSFPFGGRLAGRKHADVRRRWKARLCWPQVYKPVPASADDGLRQHPDFLAGVGSVPGPVAVAGGILGLLWPLGLEGFSAPAEARFDYRDNGLFHAFSGLGCIDRY